MNNGIARTLTAIAITIAGFGISTTPVAVAELDTSVCVVAPEVAGPDCGAAGDDNGDGFVDEDESGWDCRTMGNLVCSTEVNR